MKKPNIDFSKEGLKSFFFLHLEKLILGLSAVLLGLFFWFGFQSEVFKDMEPAQLTQKADQANAYIMKQTSWDDIQQYRQADDTVHTRIAESNTRVNLDKMLPEYRLGYNMGTPVATLGLRQDPVLIEPEDLVARAFRAPILINLQNRDKFSGLPRVSGAMVTEDVRRRGEDNPDQPDEPDQADAVVGMGTTVPEYQVIEKFGTNPTLVGASPGNQSTAIKDVVVVTGMFNLKKQWNNYDNALRNGRGYFPPRDKPNFKRVQIQRTSDGGQTWEDITKSVNDVSKYFAGNNVIFGNQGAPEVVHPKFFDPALSGPIPTFTGFDYAPYALHVDNKTPIRTMRDDEPEKAEEEDSSQPVSDGGIFGGGAASTDGNADRKDEGRRGAGGRGSRDQMESGIDEPRRGSDYHRYQRIINSSRRHGDFRLVRFYDIDVKPGESYKYRVRVWLEDPNNQPAGQAIAKKEEKGRRGDNLQAGGGTGSAGGTESAGGSGSRDGNSGSGGDDTFEEEETYEFVAVTPEMKDKRVRNRIADLKGKDFDEDIEYQKNAIAISDAEGNPVWTESQNSVTIPKVSAGFVYTGGVNPGRTTKIAGKAIPVGEPTTVMATRTWKPKDDRGREVDLGVTVPGRTEVGRSDVLNYRSSTHVMHPVDRSIRKLSDVELDTEKMVVDMMGGEVVKEISPRLRGNMAYTLQYHLPGEVLVMDVNSKEFKVQNDMTDRREFLHSLFREDDNARIGGRKNGRPAEEDDKDDRDDGFR